MRATATACLLVLIATLHLTGCSDDCKVEGNTVCRQDATYSLNSCGVEGELLEECACGCDANGTACEQGCCFPDCKDQECGDDGCGGQCAPGCGVGTTCEAGHCVCAADCAGRVCGDDGCGGTCGDCLGASEFCDDAGTCVDFLQGAQVDVCQEIAPICMVVAGCTLAENEYLEGDFPGALSFIVETLGPQVVTLNILFSQPVDQGTSTEITFYEPGCTDSTLFEDDGTGLFSDDLFTVETSVNTAGQHLVEVSSDAATHYLMRVEVD